MNSRNLSFLFFLLVLNFQSLYAQNNAINVLHYRFAISLNDSNNIIHGNAEISFLVKQAATMVYFDLTEFDNATGKGMKVLNVSSGNKVLKFAQVDDHVIIYFNDPLNLNEKKEIRINYEGVPADGLIISTSKFNRRTFFADNWPNRAHDWIPCNDHPIDKATVDFIVTAPDHYQVIANGILVEESNLPDHLKLTHWKEDLVLPTKVMVIGVADFAVQLASDINCIPITSWVFPENRDSGFAQYAVAKKILPFYINYIGPYPFHKLANVQSKTIYGGMENAGNIFYYENSVKTGLPLPTDAIARETLFAHEIAHQWFGDEASETDWQHLWLSEGFATYMTHLYMEYRYGADSLKTGMQMDRDKVIAFYKKRKTPVVDTSVHGNWMELLNANSYQKGSWVLHMLRWKLGDSVFQKGIQTYYANYKGKNASTVDFMKVMEKVSKQDLQIFFKQWLYTAGQPVLQGKWKYKLNKKLITLSIQQMQNYLFQFPLQIAIRGSQQTIFKTIDFDTRNINMAIPLNFKPESVLLDPEVNLLFEGKMEEEK
ncbi:MAG: M1 family metallopeptidase [Bacteroidota bacterium]|nr:M1 family metallopeptidase [Bacteroidota bacterium]